MEHWRTEDSTKMAFHFPEKLPAGAVLDNYYEVTGYLGSGGFADVYSGIQRDTGMAIAIKVLKPLSVGPAVRKMFEKRFLQEAQIAASIVHPNVVTMLACRENMTLTIPDSGTETFDRLYIVMELLKGRDLESELLTNGAITPKRAVSLMLACLDGLNRGHKLGIVHKDLKPSNLFLVEPGTRVEILKILDYGIARAGQAQGEKLTQAGEAVFTPQYAAPEYIDGLVATPALDVYQMGLVLIEMLTGTPVVQADTIYSCMMIHAKGIELPDNIKASALGPVLAKAIDRDHTQRYVDAAAFCDALEQLDLRALTFDGTGHPSSDTLAAPPDTGMGPQPTTGPVPPLDPVLSPFSTPKITQKEGAPKKAETLREDLSAAAPLPPIPPPDNGSGAGRMFAVLGVVVAFGLVLIGAIIIILVAVFSTKTEADIIADAIESCGSPDKCYDLARDYDKGRGVDKNTNVALALYLESCDEDHFKACRKLGNIYAEGKGTERNASKAFKYFKKACEAGKGDACYDFGEMYAEGKGVPRDNDRAALLFEEGCDKDEADACQSLGTMYAEGRGVDKNRKKAVSLYLKACKTDKLDDCFLLFKKACEGGKVADCRQFADMYLRGEGVRKNPDRAFTLHRVACEKATAEQCYEFGLNYDNGRGGVVTDDAKAAQLYQIACDKKDPKACTNLGFAYERGLGVRKDASEAARLYKKACKGDYGLGCSNTGVVYRDGIGIKQDHKEASKYFKRACDMKHIAACTNLGFQYDKGNGVKQNYDKAFKYYRQGCDGGHMLGCNNLGVMYEHGRGGATKDLVKAEALYKKACDAKNTNGCTNLDKLLKRQGRKR